MKASPECLGFTCKTAITSLKTNVFPSGALARARPLGSAQIKAADLTLTASGFDATGIHPLFTNNAGQLPLQEVDSNGYLIQAGYQIGKMRVAGTYGRTEDDGVTGGTAIDYENKGVIISYAANDYLNLVTNFSRVELDDEVAGEIETTDTLAVGATVAW